MSLSQNAPIRIAIADDHTIFRQAIVHMLGQECDFSVVGSVANGKDLLELLRREAVDVAVTDIRMPEMSGLEATQQIQKEFPQIKVLALSMNTDELSITTIIGAGARGFVQKNADLAELCKGIREVFHYGRFFCSASSEIMRKASRQMYQPGQMVRPLFSEKEKKIMELICYQYSTKQIAAELSISSRSVESTRERIQEKTGARNMVGIALFAIQSNIVVMNSLNR